MDENKRIIISILRKQNETKALLRQTSFSSNGNDKESRIKELQSRIRELQNDVERTKKAYSNVSERRVADFLKLVNVIVTSMRSERRTPSENSTLSVVLQSKEFIKLILQMTHCPQISLPLLDSLTSLILELSLSQEGRVKIFHSQLYEFLVRLIERRDLFKYPAILYRIFNTILNIVQYDRTKLALNRLNIMQKLRNWEKTVHKDPKLRSKYSVLMKELSRGRNGVNGNVGGFVSGFVGNHQKKFNNSRHHFGQQQVTTPPPAMKTPMKKKRIPYFNNNNNTPKQSQRFLSPSVMNHSGYRKNMNHNHHHQQQQVNKASANTVLHHHTSHVRRPPSQQSLPNGPPPMNHLFTSPQVRNTGTNDKPNNSFNPRRRRIPPRNLQNNNNNGRGFNHFNQ